MGIDILKAIPKGGGSEMALDYGDSHSHSHPGLEKTTLSEQYV